MSEIMKVANITHPLHIPVSFACISQIQAECNRKIMCAALKTFGAENHDSSVAALRMLSEERLIQA